MANFYAADLHLGHYNILKLCKRPFKTIEEMDEFIIENWNKVVGTDDDVYLVGDIFYKSAKNPIEYLDRLNGRKHLVVGNHDSRILKDKNIRSRFVEIKEHMEVLDGKTRIFLYHCPVVEWNGYFRGVLHFYGHIHNNVDNKAYGIMKEIPNAYNVGMDILGFIPRRLEEVIECNKKFQELH